MLINLTAFFGGFSFLFLFSCQISLHTISSFRSLCDILYL
ncbi:hypothetical protein QY97_01820 [Bacillus thermotolerans]|nr:hypothetical protein QY97_01820 [Bacillus thermotolerans]KKB44008.1 hypothetical protein QY96_00200 [Bacillus thermotolerans]